MDLKEIDILGEDISNHWYYHSKAAATLRLLGNVSSSVILDVGAGSAFFSKYLLANTVASEAWCVDISYESDSNGTEHGKQIHYRRSIDALDADLILLMDVLEHVDDDVGLLREYIDKVPRGSRFLISVPAFQFLWSGHDDYLDHKRRYTLDQIEGVLKRSGLTIERSSYYFGFVFPLALTLRLVDKLLKPNNMAPHSQLKRHSVLVNGLLRSICRTELAIFPYNRIAGLTVFCLARRP